MTNESFINETVELCNGYDSLSETQIIAICFYSVLGCLSLFGNTILILAMNRCSLIRCGGYLTVVHYAVTDILSGLLTGLYMPISVYFQDTFVPQFVSGFLLVFAEFSRKVLLLFMAVTRFYSIVFPMSARLRMTIPWYKKALASCWLVTIIVCTPFWVGRCFYFDPCQYRFRFNPKTKPWHSIYSFMINFVVTCVILTTYPICFCILKRKNYLWKIGSYSGVQCLPGTGASNSARTNNSKSKEKSIFYLFFMNSFIFIIYWLPIYLFEFWQISVPHYGLVKEIIRGVQISYNPFAYYWVNKSIRRSVNQFICCKNNSKFERKQSHSNEERF